MSDERFVAETGGMLPRVCVLIEIAYWHDYVFQTAIAPSFDLLFSAI
jgi:hypothetical protein